MVPRRDCACNHQTIPAGGVFPLATEMQAAVKYVKTGRAVPPSPDRRCTSYPNVQILGKLSSVAPCYYKYVLSPYKNTYLNSRRFKCF